MRTLRELWALGYSLQSRDLPQNPVTVLCGPVPFWAYDRLEHRSMREIVLHLRASTPCEGGHGIEVPAAYANYLESALYPLNVLDFAEKTALCTVEADYTRAEAALKKAQDAFWLIACHDLASVSSIKP